VVATTVRPPGFSLGPVALAEVLRTRRASDVLDRLARIAPDVGFLKLGPERVYVVFTPELARELLVTYGRQTAKGRGLEKARQVLGNGLLTAEGEDHRRQRRLIQPALAHDRVAGYAAEMVAAATETAAGWRPGTPVDLSAEMSGLALRAVGRALFGAELSAEATQVGDALATLMRYFQRVWLPFPVLPARYSRTQRRIEAAIATLDEVVGSVIATRRASGDTGDLVSTLLAAMPDRQVRDEVLTLMLAGHETTANALSWASLLLSRSPSAVAALQAEVDALPGTPGFADLPALPYTRAVVAESLRLYPPAWVMSRRMLEPVTLGGYRVPAGAMGALSPWVLHRDPRWWEAPVAFRPRRWLVGGQSGGAGRSGAAARFDEAAPGQPRGAYLPFGAGRRVCVGSDFAWTEAVLVLATLAREWTLRPAPGCRVDLFPAITLRPRYGLLMIPSRR
jgi:cytochrome P450